MTQNEYNYYNICFNVLNVNIIDFIIRLILTFKNCTFYSVYSITLYYFVILYKIIKYSYITIVLTNVYIGLDVTC